MKRVCARWIALRRCDALPAGAQRSGTPAMRPAGRPSARPRPGRSPAQGALVVTAVLALALTAGGCWDRQEIENLATVLAVGIDMAEPPDKFRITAQMSVPSQITTAGPASANEQHPTNWIVTSTGRTIFEAVRKLELQVPRKTYWSNLLLVVFGEDFARSDAMGEALDFFERDEEPRERAWVFIAKDATGADVMRTFIPVSLLSADGIDNFMNVSALRTGSIPRRNLHDLYQMLTAPGWEAYVARIGVLSEENPDAAQNRLPQGPVTTLHPLLGGAAVFKGVQLAGWLDEDQARGLLFVHGDVRGSVLNVACDADGSEEAVIELISARGSLEPMVADGRITAKVVIRAAGKLGEAACAAPATTNVLNERFARAIEEQVRSAVDVLQQELRSDALGLGLELWRRYPRVWREVSGVWDELFPTVPVDIEVKAAVRRSGLITAPSWGR